MNTFQGDDPDQPESERQTGWPRRYLVAFFLSIGLLLTILALNQASWLSGGDAIVKLDGTRVQWTHHWLPFLSLKYQTESIVFDIAAGENVSTRRLVDTIVTTECCSSKGIIVESRRGYWNNFSTCLLIDSKTGETIGTLPWNQDDPFGLVKAQFSTSGDYLALLIDLSRNGSRGKFEMKLFEIPSLKQVDSRLLPSGLNWNDPFVFQPGYLFTNRTHELIRFEKGEFEEVPVVGLEYLDEVLQFNTSGDAIVFRSDDFSIDVLGLPLEPEEGVAEENSDAMNDPTSEELRQNGEVSLLPDSMTEGESNVLTSDGPNQKFLFKNLFSGSEVELESPYGHRPWIYYELRGSDRNLVRRIDHVATIFNASMTPRFSIHSDHKLEFAFVEETRVDWEWQLTPRYAQPYDSIELWSLEKGAQVGFKNFTRASRWQYFGTIGLASFCICFSMGLEYFSQRRSLLVAGFALVLAQALVTGLSLVYGSELAVKVSVGLGMGLAMLLAVLCLDTSRSIFQRVVLCGLFVGLSLIAPAQEIRGYRLEVIVALIGAIPLSAWFLKKTQWQPRVVEPIRNAQFAIGTLFLLVTAFGVGSTVVYHLYWKLYLDLFSYVWCLALMLQTSILGVALLNIGNRKRRRAEWSLAVIPILLLVSTCNGFFLPTSWPTKGRDRWYVNGSHFSRVLTEPFLSLTVMGLTMGCYALIASKRKSCKTSID